jgi:pyruvate/2-oxoglutarate dehydrogenase complex dihydrolipoamide acyltransferase (E2) component
MSETRMVMPRVSEAIDESFVVEWLVAVGGTVVVDQPLLRVETDKAMVDIPSTVAGTLTEQLVSVDDEITTGAEVAVFESI